MTKPYLKLIRERCEKVYIHYAYDDSEAPINEVWSDGYRPKKKLLKDSIIKVYDVAKNSKELINSRDWDGEE